MKRRIDLMKCDSLHAMTAQPPFAAFAPAIRAQSPLRQAITAAYRRDEAEALAPLIA
ncbi:MAG: hypothetical protein KKH54_08865, partial [Alphaproteobacteria bacterium]|nr:hypothetical protein [Alphaproteobacteria bacterium]